MMGVSYMKAQEKGLQVGMPVPDMAIGHSLNASQQLGTFNDYKGKLVILDFWHTTCASCLRGFPEMNRLQQKFGDKIKIFLITKNTDMEVNKLFERLKPSVELLTIVSQDSLWNKLFPHLSNPHHVWIGPDGVYRYATFDHNATEQNIEKFLKEGAVQLSTKQIGGFKDGGMIDQANGVFQKFTEKKSVLLKGYYEYAIGSGLRISEDSISRLPNYIRASGFSPLELLKCANFDRIFGYNPGIYGIRDGSRTIIEVKTPEALLPPKDRGMTDVWKANNFYGYELFVKPQSARTLYDVMRSDIETALPYQASVEMRAQQYLALIRTGNDLPVKASGERSIYFENRAVYFQSAPVSEIIKNLNDNARITALPIIDETAIKYNIDFSAPLQDFYQFDALKKRLQSIGLDIVERNGKIPMLVVRDK